MATPDATRQTGRITAFYGYKGGTGRSFTCASVAYALAVGLGRSVLVIDFDLEAPGIGDFFSSLEQRVEQAWRRNPGLVALIDSHADVRDQEELLDALGPGFWRPTPVARYDRERSDAPFLLRIWSTADERACLDLLGPGEVEDPAYPGQIMGADWNALFEANGEDFFKAFGGVLRDRYDHVLIDLRTGFNVASGRAAATMADHLVLFATPMHQSVMGAADMKRWLLEQTHDAPPAKITSVLSRVETEGQPSRAGQLFALRMAAPGDIAERCDFELPFVPKGQSEHLLWERIARHGPTEESDALARALEALAQAIDRRGDHPAKAFPDRWWQTLSKAARSRFSSEATVPSEQAARTADHLLAKLRQIADAPAQSSEAGAAGRSQKPGDELKADFDQLSLIEAALFRERLRREVLPGAPPEVLNDLQEHLGLPVSIPEQLPTPKPMGLWEAQEAHAWREALAAARDPGSIGWACDLAACLYRMRLAGAVKDFPGPVPGLGESSTFEAASSALLKIIAKMSADAAEARDRVRLLDARLRLELPLLEDYRSILTPSVRRDLRAVVRQSLRDVRPGPSEWSLYWACEAASEGLARAMFLNSDPGREDERLLDRCLLALDALCDEFGRPERRTYEAKLAGGHMINAAGSLRELGFAASPLVWRCAMAGWQSGALDEPNGEAIGNLVEFAFAATRSRVDNLAIETLSGLYRAELDAPTARVLQIRSDIPLHLATLAADAGRPGQALAKLNRFGQEDAAWARLAPSILSWRIPLRRMAGDLKRGLADVEARRQVLRLDLAGRAVCDADLLLYEVQAAHVQILAGAQDLAVRSLGRLDAMSRPRHEMVEGNLRVVWAEGMLIGCLAGRYDPRATLTACLDVLSSGTSLIAARRQQTLRGRTALLAAALGRNQTAARLATGLLEHLEQPGAGSPFSAEAAAIARLTLAATTSGERDRLGAARRELQRFAKVMGGGRQAAQRKAAGNLLSEAELYAARGDSDTLRLTLGRLRSAL